MRSLYEAINDSDEKVLDRAQDALLIWLMDTFGCKGEDIHDLKDGVYSIKIRKKKVVIDNTHGHNGILFGLGSATYNPTILVHNAKAFYELFKWPHSYGIDNYSGIKVIYDTDEDLSFQNIPTCHGTIVVKRCKSFTFPTGMDTKREIDNLILHKKGIGKIYGVQGLDNIQELTIKQ